MKVLISLGKSFYETFPDLGSWLRREGIEVVEQTGYDQEPPRELMRELVKDVDVYVVGVDRIDREILEAASALKLIVKHGVGVDNIDLDCAKEKGIAVTFARGCNAQSVAELAIALMLSVCRGIPWQSTEVRQGAWNLYMGCELNKKTLGLIGYGNIGSRVAKIAKAFGMEVIAFDPYIGKEALQEAGIRPGTMEEVLRQADFVSLHAPAAKENRKLIDQKALAYMKPTAYLINTARGELVNEEALQKALQEGKLRGAALDVFWREPPDARLTGLSGTVCTPHLGACTIDSARKLSEMSFENIMNFKKHQPLKNRLV